MKRLLPFLIAALMIPGAALAKGPNPHSGTHANSGKNACKKCVMYVLKGTLSNYSAYDSSGGNLGSITIEVSHANRHGRALVKQSLTLSVGANTKVVLANGNTTVNDNDLGIVKVRAPKAWDSSDPVGFLEGYSARQIVDPANLPNPAADSNASQGTVMYVIKGKLSGFTPYDSSSGTPGSITIDVSRANRHGKALAGQTLIFTGMVAASTRLVLHNGATTIGDNDLGILKVRAPKAWNITDPSQLVTFLEGYSFFQIIDQKPTS